MLFVRLLLPALALLLLGAHFYRAGGWPLTALTLALLPLLAVPRVWAVRTLQAALVVGALEWLRTLAGFAAMRLAGGQPYLRLTTILFALAVFTLLSAWLLQRRAVRPRS
jgi:hypothetical protein